MLVNDGVIYANRVRPIKRVMVAEAPVVAESGIAYPTKQAKQSPVPNTCPRCKCYILTEQRVNVTRCSMVGGNYKTVKYCTNCDYEEFE